MTKSATSVPNTLSQNDESITDPIKLANIFNNFFRTIAAKTKSKIKFSKKDFSDFLKTKNLDPATKEDICNIISSLNPNKSTGPLSIPLKILKLLKKDISSQLNDIFNLSVATGVFPTNLKTAKVIPVHKKESKLDFSNYRPISLLSNLDKIFEKLMHNRLTNFLEKNNIIYPLQFGFRTNYSTTHALIHLTNLISESLDNGKFVRKIFVDLQNAFDTVNHRILLSELEHYGIRGIGNKWFETDLCNGKHYVSINGFKSNTSTLTCGVSQGSVFEPLLFLIYINDLCRAIRFCHVHHFADDTNLLHINKSPKILNKLISYDLKNMSNWVNANKITLNVTKTEFFIFKPRRKKLDFEFKIKLNGKKLFPANSVKYLGLKIDKQLN